MVSFGEVFYTEQLSSGLRIAQVVGLTSTAFYCGKTFAASFVTTPALLEAPAPLLARQWKTMNDYGEWMAPATAIINAGVFGYLAYTQPNMTKTTILYTSAASLAAVLIPYDLLFITPINRRLEDKAESLARASIVDTGAETRVAREDTVHVLVDHWATANLGRSIIAGTSAVLATWAAIDRVFAIPVTAKLTTGADRMGW